MDTLKIEIPEGYEIETFDKQIGEIKFKKKAYSITERIKTIADVLLDNGLTRDQFDDQCEGLSSDEISYRILKLMVRSLNEGWVPDWDNHIESKYYPWFELGGSSGFRFDDCDDWRSRSYVGSRLCFKSYELAEHAGKYFIDVYQKFMVI